MIKGYGRSYSIDTQKKGNIDETSSPEPHQKRKSTSLRSKDPFTWATMLLCIDGVGFSDLFGLHEKVAFYVKQNTWAVVPRAGKVFF
jgi:hypothetical protein